jgi:predicted kinase
VRVRGHAHLADRAPVPLTVPALIVVTGAPGSGKSTIAAPLAEYLRLPLIAKDELKEALWDNVGAGGKEQFDAYGRASYPLMHLIAKLVLRAGCSAVLEGNVSPDWAAEELGRLQAETPFRFVQVLCVADPETCLARYRERAESDRRHPMHAVGGEESDAGVERRLREGLWERPIPLKGALFRVDTNRPVDVDALADEIASVLTAA